MPAIITGRLTNSPFPSQVKSIQRTRAEKPHRLSEWFKFWEEKPREVFRTAYAQLDDPQKMQFLDLQAVYEAIVQRRFKYDPTIEVETTSMIDAFRVMGELVKVVAQKHSNSLFILGPGGTGKTYTVLETLANEGLRPGIDYQKIAGYSTPLALYNNLFYNKDGLLVFDDCDSIFKDLTGLNILKTVLDTLPVRHVSWNSTSKLAAAEDFRFTGQVIFISNMEPKKTKDPNFRALMTRTLSLAIDASKEEIIFRMIQILPTVGVELTQAQREDIIRFLHANKDHLEDPSLRYLVHLVSLKKYSDSKFEELALAVNT